MSRYLLGYDIRVGFSAFADGHWDARKRAVFLLNPEICSPASVDPWIWPSIFRYLHLYQSPIVTPHQGAIAMEPTNFEHSVTCLWPDLEAMNACIADHAVTFPVVPVAIVLHGADAQLQSDHTVAVLDSDRMRAAPPDNWTSLGYDVADQGLTSGLSNSGYNAAEKLDWQRTWAPRLNDCGLFTTADDAEKFVQACDARVPEHAPFFTYELVVDPSAI